MNLGSIAKAIGSWVAGVFILLILLPLTTELMTTLNSGTLAVGDTIEGIIWVGVILIWALTSIVLPIYFMNAGAREEDNIPNAVKVIAGTLIFFFSIMITYQAWFMLTGISNAMTSTTQQAFFWIGLIANWITITLIVPTYLIMEGTGTELPKIAG